jgi:uncharacterized membrane-anchored protein
MTHTITAARAGWREPVAAKVPEIMVLFWVLKLLTTAGGEAFSDYLDVHGNAVAAAAEILIFVVAVIVQFRTRRYVAAAYWFLALAIAIFGTGVADAMHVVLGIPYAGTSALWAAALAVIFWLWNRSEGTLSIHSITTTRRELYYWATVFATFALGTALGDFTATSLGLGYLASGILFAVVILIPAVAWRLGLSPVLAFWSAYVITRPLGASFADYLSKPFGGGLGYGDLTVSIALICALAVLVAYTAITRRDIQQPAAAVPPPARGHRIAPDAAPGGPPRY